MRSKMGATAGHGVANFIEATHKHNYSCDKVLVRGGFELCKDGVSFKSRSPQPPRFLPLNPTTLAVRVRCSSSSAAATNDDDQPNQQIQANSFWKEWRLNSREISAKMAKLGLAAVLAYGLLDAVTYTTFFVIAFHGYAKTTGKNPAANIKALIGIVILMWTGNNITRPFRVAGAAALAPAVDKGLNRLQKHLNLPSMAYAFALVVGAVAASCLTVVGLLILSRLRLGGN